MDGNRGPPPSDTPVPRGATLWEIAYQRGRVGGFRDVLLEWLGERFGPLPAELVQRIEATEDLARLRAAIQQAVRVEKLEDFQL
jgi:hypothetical protein